MVTVLNDDLDELFVQGVLGTVQFTRLRLDGTVWDAL